MQTEPPNLARATIRGTLWTYAAFYGGKVMVFLSTIVLARLLTQDDFGVVGYAVAAISFLDVMADLGVGVALIYYGDDARAAHTAFWLSQGMGLALFGLTWLLAPLFGAFFQDVRAVPVIRALALTFPISALGNVHDNLLRKELAFGRKFIPDFLQATSKGLFSIALAALGQGPWSLIVGQVMGSAVAVVGLWAVLPWRPALVFAPALARALLTYGGNMVGVNALGYVALNMDYFLVGRYLGPAALGVYTLAFRIPELLIMQFCNLVARVVFPVYSKLRDDPQALTRGFVTTTRYVAMVTVPLSLGLALVARPFVLAVLTEKWAATIPVMRAIAIYSLVLSLAYNAGDVYKAQGRPAVLTLLSLVRAVVLFPALLWSVSGPASLALVGWVQVAVACLGSALNLWIAARMLHTSLRRIGTALYPAAAGGALMSLATLAALRLSSDSPAWVQLTVGALAGAVAYGAALWWLQREVMLSAGHTLRMAIGRR